MRRKCLVFDVDGVLLLFSKPFSEWWNKQHAPFGPNNVVLSDNPHVWNFTEHIREEHLQQDVNTFIATSPTLSLVSSDIPERMTHFRREYDIHLVTAWPEAWAEDRIRNLEHHGIVYDSIQFVTPPVNSIITFEANQKPVKKVSDGIGSGKLRCVQAFNPTAVIEDKPSTLQEMSDAGFAAVAPSHWNYVKQANFRDNSIVHLYDDWNHLDQIIEKLGKDT